MAYVLPKDNDALVTSPDLALKLKIPLFYYPWGIC